MITNADALAVATAVARALEALIGHDIVLTVGDVSPAALDENLLPDPARAIALPFTAGAIGELTLVAASPFALSIEAASANGSLERAAISLLEHGADTNASAMPPTNRDHAGEISIDTLLSIVDGDFFTVPVFEGDAHVASIVIRVIDEPAPIAAPTTAAPMAPPAPRAVAAAPMASAIPTASPAIMPLPNEVARHEFQPLGDGQPHTTMARSLTLLNEVNMEVRAELGRMRMTVRDLIDLAPGSVIELDRAAGSPVDVLANGSILAHGEVVVIDEEFGVRVSEIVVGDL